MHLILPESTIECLWLNVCVVCVCASMFPTLRRTRKRVASVKARIHSKIYTACFKIRSINKMNVLSNEQFMPKNCKSEGFRYTFILHSDRRAGYAKIRTFLRSIRLQILKVTCWLPMSFHGSFLLTFFNYGFDLISTLFNFPDRKNMQIWWNTTCHCSSHDLSWNTSIFQMKKRSKKVNFSCVFPLDPFQHFFVRLNDAIRYYMVRNTIINLVI